MRDALECVAIFAATFYAGATAYVTLVEHPARLASGSDGARRAAAD